ncbi:hypothetical protein BE17_07270 [Sorangium cellulosum]|uniref:Uncharacterized protein n=1 Tax=Sorangium cellulosum TaxID=56 RepID=A0A150S5A8_SORCE|nr:hypothetical protein BE17_07270 [Sorangium cellulosum]
MAEEAPELVELRKNACAAIASALERGDLNTARLAHRALGALLDSSATPEPEDLTAGLLDAIEEATTGSPHGLSAGSLFVDAPPRLAAILQALRDEGGPTTPIGLGRLLGRLRGRDLGGRTVACKTIDGQTLWRVETTG